MPRWRSDSSYPMQSQLSDWKPSLMILIQFPDYSPAGSVPVYLWRRKLWEPKLDRFLLDERGSDERIPCRDPRNRDDRFYSSSSSSGKRIESKCGVHKTLRRKNCIYYFIIIYYNEITSNWLYINKFIILWNKKYKLKTKV